MPRNTVIIYSDTVLLVNIEQCLQMLIKFCELNINQKNIKVIIIINKISELSITLLYAYMKAHREGTIYKI